MAPAEKDAARAWCATPCARSISTAPSAWCASTRASAGLEDLDWIVPHNVPRDPDPQGGGPRPGERRGPAHRRPRQQHGRRGEILPDAHHRVGPGRLAGLRDRRGQPRTWWPWPSAWRTTPPTSARQRTLEGRESFWARGPGGQRRPGRRRAAHRHRVQRRGRHGGAAAAVRRGQGPGLRGQGLHPSAPDRGGARGLRARTGGDRQGQADRAGLRGGRAPGPGRGQSWAAR